MATEEFKLPELGENIESGDVVRVAVNAGEMINEGQTVVELETDKAVIEVPSTVNGVIEKVIVAPSQRVGWAMCCSLITRKNLARKPRPRRPRKSRRERARGNNACREGACCEGACGESYGCRGAGSSCGGGEGDSCGVQVAGAGREY